MKKQKACDLNVMVIYDLAIKLQYCKHDRKYFSHVNLELEPRTLKVELARDIVKPNVCVVILKSINEYMRKSDDTVFLNQNATVTFALSPGP